MRRYKAVLSLLVFTLASCGGDPESPATSGSPTGNASGASGAGGNSGGAGGSSGGAAGTSGGAAGTVAGSSGAAGTTTTSIDKAADCTDTFGSALTNSFGRLDGTVLAVVKPTDVECPMPNDDHVILEVVMNGEAYRMVVNVQSNNAADPQVWYLAIEHPLPAPAWSDGWHTGLSLDYVKDMAVKSTDFAQHPIGEMSDIIANEITLGQKISVYATSSGGASAHLVHRQNGLKDGAIILDPEAAKPRVLLFHFSEQTF